MHLLLLPTQLPLLPLHATVVLAARSGGDLVHDDLTTAALLLAAAGWGVFLLARTYWGPHRRPRRRHDAPGRVDMPDDPPAVAHALHNGGATPSLLGVLVLDLARRGYLRIVQEEQGWRFVRKDTPRGDLAPYENAVYTRLFAAGNDTSQSSLVEWAETNRQQARVFLERIRRYVAADMRQRGYLERPRRLPVALNLAASAVVVLVGLLALFSGAVAGLVAVASGAIQASRTRMLRRHTLAGADRAQEWAEVAHALEEVADLDEDPATDREGWERCLVYAAALGVAGPFVAGLERRSGTVPRGKDFAAWYEESGYEESGPEGVRHEKGGGHRLEGVGRLTASLGPALAETAERPSRMVTAPG